MRLLPKRRSKRRRRKSRRRTAGRCARSSTRYSKRSSSRRSSIDRSCTCGLEGTCAAVPPINYRGRAMWARADPSPELLFPRITSLRVRVRAQNRAVRHDNMRPVQSARAALLDLPLDLPQLLDRIAKDRKGKAGCLSATCDVTPYLSTAAAVDRKALASIMARCIYSAKPCSHFAYPCCSSGHLWIRIVEIVPGDRTYRAERQHAIPDTT